MKQVEYLSHTADIRVLLKANNRVELFEGALEGMNNILKPGVCNESEKIIHKSNVRVMSNDITSLLIDFLNDVLTLTHTLKIIFCALEVHHLDDNEIDATVTGVSVASFDEDIKAVTYHEADVQLNNNGQLETVIVFDI
jgi:SHS2 domain-containing protein